MSEPAKKGAIYEDLCSIPENMTGEIIDGELFVHPRPSRKHIYEGAEKVRVEPFHEVEIDLGVLWRQTPRA